MKKRNDGVSILQDEVNPVRNPFACPTCPIVSKGVKIEIADICLLLRIKYPGMKERVSAHYKNFLSNGKPDVIIDVESFDGPKPHFRTLIFQDSTWKLYRENGYFFLQFSRNPRCALGKFDASIREIKFYIDIHRCGRQLISPFLEMIFRLILSRHNAIVMHACGVSDGKKGYFFTAPSGGGKSTIAKLALREGLTVLNDDRIIIRKKNGRFMIYGNPWHGAISKITNNPPYLKEAFFLKKSESNGIIPMAKTEALSMFLKNHSPFPLNGNTRKMFEVCFELAEKLECYWLEFRPDKTIWRFLNEMVR